MLNRITTPQALIPRSGPVSWRQELLSGQAAWLPKLVVLLVAGCVMTSLYLWQASVISTMRTKAMQLDYEAAGLERENVRLVTQLAQWIAPSYIDGKSAALGLLDASAPLRVHVTQPPAPAEAQRDTTTGSVAVWRRLTDWLP
jgi:hypothetical protein